MAKLMLTTSCNQDCSYCFAKKKRNLNTSSSEMNIDLLEHFLRLSQRNPVTLSGGEPVLHSQFPEILTIINRAKRKVALLTNGGYDSERLNGVSLRGIRRTLLNAHSEPQTTSIQNNVRKNVITLLSNKIHLTLGCTLYSNSMDLHFFFTLLKEYRIRSVRLSLVNPFERNSFFQKMESFILNLSPLFQSVVKQLNDMDIIPTIDCGVPPCIVAQDKYKEFRRRSFWGDPCGSDLNLFPDGYLHHCHCSLDKTYPIEMIDEARIISQENEETLRWAIPSMQRCINCYYWINKICQGGCLGWKL